MPNITLIAALDYARAIGRSGGLPWKLRADLTHFKKVTEGHVVVMGRKTFDSIPPKFRPLPNRWNVIISRNRALQIPQCTVMHSVEEIQKTAAIRPVFVIGGAEIYHMFYPYAERLLLTHVQTVVEGADAFFPEVALGWSQTLIGSQQADAHNDFAFSIVEYRKIDMLIERRP